MNIVNVNEYLGPERMQVLFHSYADEIKILCLPPPKDIPLELLYEYKITYGDRGIIFKSTESYKEIFNEETALFIIKSFRMAELQGEKE